MVIQNYIYDGGTLTAAPTVQGTVVPDLTKRIMRAAALVNTTAAAISATVFMVPPGGAPDAAHTLISARPIAPGETYPCPELVNQGLNAGGSVQAQGVGLTFKYTATEFV